MIEETIELWYPYENGDTIGEVGFDGGIILRDEEYGDPNDAEYADARLTLERGGIGLESRRLTANLYGWLQAQRDYPAEAKALADFDHLKGELSRLADLIPDEDDRTIALQVETLGRELDVLKHTFLLSEVE